MKLTGKSLEQFEKWYTSLYFKLGKNNFTHIDCFWSQQDSMQYGVLIDFFDSVGIYINIIGNVFHSYQLYVDSTLITHFDSRPQARTKAIETANEIYNKR